MAELSREVPVLVLEQQLSAEDYAQALCCMKILCSLFAATGCGRASVFASPCW